MFFLVNLSYKTLIMFKYDKKVIKKVASEIATFSY